MSSTVVIHDRALRKALEQEHTAEHSRTAEVGCEEDDLGREVLLLCSPAET
jgi:hypothetical protein